jgi:dTDP-4-amino-4,6-dideoxygalactose transaminase
MTTTGRDRVPFLDLGAGYAELASELEPAALEATRSGMYIGGSQVEDFERDFAAYVGAPHCAGVGNGLDAIMLALMAVGVAPGDEVIVPSHTFIATWLAVSRLGAHLVPVEPDPSTMGISAAAVERALTPRTKAIIPVHLYGLPVDLDPILALAERRGIHVIEDAAQAHGTAYRGRRIGAHGHAVAWSFYPGKNLGAYGDAGAVTTSHSDIDDRVRMLRNYGSRRKYVHEIQGINSRLDPVQAAMLRVRLRHLDRWNARRVEIAARYLRGLAGMRVTLPVVPGWASPVWHLFVVRVKSRDAVQRALAARGIETLIHYPNPPHRQGAYADAAVAQMHLPVAEELAQTVLSLPMGPHLRDEQVDRVIEAIGACC